MKTLSMQGRGLTRETLLLMGLGLLAMVGLARAGSGLWLITPEEAAMRPAEDGALTHRGSVIDVGREAMDLGPVIEVMKPTPGGSIQGPLEVVVRFTPRTDPVDVSTLKVGVVKFVTIDITDRVRPYVTRNGIEIKDAQIPSGKHTVRISVGDKAGQISSKEISFEVL